MREEIPHRLRRRAVAFPRHLKGPALNLLLPEHPAERARIRKVLGVERNEQGGVRIFSVPRRKAHTVGRDAAGLRGRRDHKATGAHTEGIRRAAVRQVAGELIIRGRKLRPARLAVLGKVDLRLRMLDPRAHGKGLRLHRNLHFGQPAEGIARAVAHGQYQRIAGKLRFLAVLTVDRAREPAVFGSKPRQLRAEADLAAQRLDAPPQILHDLKQHIRSDVGLGVIEDLLLRARADELLQHPPAALVFRAGVQLSVGKGSGAALAELYVRFRVERAAVPEGLHLFPALRRGLAAFQNDRAQSRHGKHQCREHPRRAEAGDDRPFFALRVRHVIAVRLFPRDLRTAAAAQNGALPAAERHVDRVDPAQLRLLPRVQRTPEDLQGGDVRRLHPQALRRMIAQRVLIVRLRQNNIPDPNHSIPLNSPARRPDDHAHCKL